MKLNDILGVGKILPIDKLIEIISNSVGKISKPYFDRKDVDTKAYEIKKLAEARAEEIKIIAEAVKENFPKTGGIEYKEDKLLISSPKDLPLNSQTLLLTNASSIEERTRERLNFQEAKKQLNIENVTAFATDELKNGQPVTDERLDDDWTTRFFRIIEDISNEEMQSLWGKILAGEIKHPKSYSLRTLELIRNLSKKEADIFIKVANFAIKSGNDNFIFKGNIDDKLEKEYSITYMDIALLTEIGLLQPGSFVTYELLQQSTNNRRLLIAGNIVIVINIKANTPTIQMPVEVFSSSGNELLKLVNSKPPIDYLTYIANSIKNENIEVKYGNLLALREDSVEYSLPLRNFI